MKKVAITILAVALVAVGTVFVFGQTSESEGPKMDKAGHRGHFGKRGKRGKRGMHLGRMFRKLDLTEDQKAQMKTIRQNSRESVKPLQQQLRENRKALQSLTEGGTFDEAQVTAIAQQMGSIHAQLIVQKEKTKTALFNVLTDEQKAKVAEFKQQRKERMDAWKAKKAEKSNAQ